MFESNFQSLSRHRTALYNIKAAFLALFFDPNSPKGKIDKKKKEKIEREESIF